MCLPFSVLSHWFCNFGKLNFYFPPLGVFFFLMINGYGWGYVCLKDRQVGKIQKMFYIDWAFFKIIVNVSLRKKSFLEILALYVIVPPWNMLRTTDLYFLLFYYTFKSTFTERQLLGLLVGFFFYVDVSLDKEYSSVFCNSCVLSTKDHLKL